ncbi:MAG: PAS domain-containing protein, partial [Bacteroidetes bacterium]|nr:PAS domain-containing protein [Bacteroidota bacterium]
MRYLCSSAKVLFDTCSVTNGTTSPKEDKPMPKAAKQTTGQQTFKKQLEQLAHALQHLQLNNPDLPALAEKDTITNQLAAALDALSKVEHILRNNVKAADDASASSAATTPEETKSLMEVRTVKDAGNSNAQAQGVFSVQQHKVQYINANLVQLLGYSAPEELIDAPLSSILHPSFSKAFEQYQLQALHQNLDKIPGALLHKDGTALEVMLGFMAVFSPERPVILVMVQPASNRQQSAIADYQQLRMEYLLKESPSILYTAEAHYPYALTFVS